MSMRNVQKLKLRIAAAVIFAVLLLLPLTIYAAGEWINIEVKPDIMNLQVNGNPVYKTNFLYLNTTYVPIRAVSEMLGATVTWKAEGNVANIVDTKYNAAMTDNKFMSVFNEYGPVINSLRSDVIKVMGAAADFTAQGDSDFMITYYQNADQSLGNLKAKFTELRTEYASIGTAGYTPAITQTDWQTLLGYINEAVNAADQVMNEEINYSNSVTDAQRQVLEHYLTLSYNRTQKAEYWANYFYEKYFGRITKTTVPAPSEPAGIDIVPLP